MKSLCGQAFRGKVTKDNSNDDRFADKEIILHIRDCSDERLKMPMHVGDDHSRIFILKKIKGGLHFRHDHRHSDGSEDKITLYGGKTNEVGTAKKQDFPVDDYSKKLFLENGLNVYLELFPSIGQAYFLPPDPPGP